MNFMAALSDISLDCFTSNENKKYQYGIFTNGVFLKRKELVGTFIVPYIAKDLSSTGLKNKCENKFIWNLPKFPIGILLAMDDFFREVYKKVKSEVFVHIFWDIQKEDYFFYVPEQKVSGASVTYKNNSEFINNSNCVLVGEFHSHANLNAFFSQQDDKDEQGTRIFGVIGEVDKKQSKVVIRASSMAQRINLTVEETFDYSSNKKYFISLDNLDKIEEYVPPKLKVIPNLTSTNVYYTSQTTVAPLPKTLEYDLKSIARSPTSVNILNLVESFSNFISEKSIGVVDKKDILELFEHSLLNL